MILGVFEALKLQMPLVSSVVSHIKSFVWDAHNTSEVLETIGALVNAVLHRLELKFTIILLGIVTPIWDPMSSLLKCCCRGFLGSSKTSGTYWGVVNLSKAATYDSKRHSRIGSAISMLEIMIMFA